MKTSTNAVVQSAVAARINEAAGKLLAAEAEFLTSHHWVPHSVQSAIPQMEQKAIVMWRAPASGKLYGQGEAVRIVKISDPYMSTKDYTG